MYLGTCDIIPVSTFNAKLQLNVAVIRFCFRTRSCKKNSITIQVNQQCYSNAQNVHREML